MLDRLEGGEDEEDRRAKSLVEEELGKFNIRMYVLTFLITFVERALKTTEELSKETRRRSRKGKKFGSKRKSSRLGKQSGFDSDFIDVLLDSLDIDEKDDLEFDEDFGNSGRRTKTVEETRSSSGGSLAEIQRKPKSNTNETCEDKQAENKVQVCVPEYDVQPQRLYFTAQETYDEKYCYSK